MIRADKMIALAIAIAASILAAGCGPEKALDFGPVGEISTPPEDPLSRDILRDFAGKQFDLGNNDHEAHVSLTDSPNAHRVVLPFWLGVNPLYPGFLRPKVGHIYVASESTMVRPLNNHNEYLIRAGSKLFKSDTVFECARTRYTGTGGMLPTIVRFVGTRVITVPRDAPSTGTITEKVPVLREVSLPMHTTETLPGYAKFEVQGQSSSPVPGKTQSEMPLPPWLGKMTTVQASAKYPDRIEECVYEGNRVFLVTHTDRFDTGHENVLLNEDGKELCEFGGYANRVTSGACDISKIEHKRTVVDGKRARHR